MRTFIHCCNTLYLQHGRGGKYCRQNNVTVHLCIILIRLVINGTCKPVSELLWGLLFCASDASVLLGPLRYHSSSQLTILFQLSTQFTHRVPKNTKRAIDIWKHLCCVATEKPIL